MKDVGWLQASYSNFLTSQQESLQKSIAELTDRDCVDEANFERIRLNVVGIFAQMFRISCTDDYHASQVKYLGFFRKIMAPWYDNREKAVEFGNEMEKIIEDVKISTAQELQATFQEYYGQLDLDQRCAP